MLKALKNQNIRIAIGFTVLIINAVILITQLT